MALDSSLAAEKHSISHRVLFDDGASRDRVACNR